jgi:predicted aspartyl protease
MGFTGDLMVPSLLASILKLEIIGDERVSWFDGTVTGLVIARGTIDWFGTARPCTVLISDKGQFTLIGMGLLKDAKLEIHFHENRVRMVQG